MNTENICMGCMAEKGTAAVCRECGWIEGTQPEHILQLAPRTLIAGQYLLGRVIGQGGFGITYVAWDLANRRKVAVKEFFPQSIATRLPGSITVAPSSSKLRAHYDYGQKRFADEANVLMLLQNHPCIVSFLDFLTANGTGYLVMEYLDGVTLKDFLHQNGERLPSKVAIQIVMRILDGLREVHEHRGPDGSILLHRDISPDNVFITQSKQVKLLDFGAARFALGEHSQTLTIILKPGYAPPEQYKERARQGAGTDLYAVAATLYRAVTGRGLPVSLERQDDAPLPMPSKLGVSLPANVEAAIQKALMLNLEDRFKSAREFQQALLDPKPVGTRRIDEKVIMKPAPHPLLAYAAGIACFLAFWGGLSVIINGGVAVREIFQRYEQLLSQLPREAPKVSNVRSDITINEDRIEAKVAFQIRPFSGRTGCAAVFFNDARNQPIKDASGQHLAMVADFTSTDDDAPVAVLLSTDLKGSGLDGGSHLVSAWYEFYGNPCNVQNDKRIFQSEPRQVTLKVPLASIRPEVSDVTFAASVADKNLRFALTFQLQPTPWPAGCAAVELMKDGLPIQTNARHPLRLSEDFTSTVPKTEVTLDQPISETGLASGTQRLEAVINVFASGCRTVQDAPIWKSSPTIVTLEIPDTF